MGCNVTEDMNMAQENVLNIEVCFQPEKTVYYTSDQ